MNLVIDIGNTLTKIAVFEGRLIQAFLRIEGADTEKIRKFIDGYSGLDACIISSVNANPAEIVNHIGLNIQPLILDHLTLLPFRNSYSTPETLGKDRLAGVAAAVDLFPGQDVLVIDAGTAITFDLLSSESEYMGGSISPGIRMRYRALHTFTGRLPLLEMVNNARITGNNTTDSIHSGVLNGVVFEVEGTIHEYLRAYSNLQIILTGGDYNYFDKRLKVKTFAAPNLVLNGLNIILNYNLEKKYLQ